MLPRAGGTAGAVLNAANEAAIPEAERFYATDVAFHAVLYDIPRNPILPAVHKSFTAWLGERFAYAGFFLVLLMVPFLLDSSLSLVTTASLSRLASASSMEAATSGYSST